MNAENGLYVEKIENGTVIDHIPAWQLGLVLRVLDIDRIKRDSPDLSIVPAQNVTSHKMGTKDLLKLSKYFISEGDADIVRLIFPGATINYVKNRIPEKYSPKIPEVIEGKLKCPEVMCITNKERETDSYGEPIKTKFSVLDNHKKLQCQHCNTQIPYSKIPEYVKSS